MKKSILIFIINIIFIIPFSSFANNKNEISIKANNETQPYMQSIATTGYIYGLPYVGMYEMLYKQVLNQKTKTTNFNQYQHDRDLATDKTTFVPSPNNDTLYSKVWLDLRKEPAVLEFPNFKNRYFSLQLFDMNSDLLGYIGTRETGNKAGKFLIVGPNWNGKISEDFTKVYKAKTNFVLGLARTLISGPEELNEVHKIQNSFKVASLSRWKQGKIGGGNIKNFPIYKNSSSNEFFETLSVVLKMNPIIKGEEGIIADLNNINVAKMIITKPNYTYNQTTIQKGYELGIKSLKGALQFWGEFINGWKVTISGVGKYDFDYMQRAVVWQGGALANEAKEATYPTALFDKNGQMLDGNNNYILKFTKNQLPPVNYFWSLTMYDLKTTFLISNELNRYSIGDRTPNIKYDKNGGLTIYLSSKNPGGDKTSNWLPTPKAPFYMVLRLYGPKESVLDGKWKPAGIEKIN